MTQKNNDATNNTEKTLQGNLDKALETVQKGLLKSARKIQKTYGSLKRGDNGLKVNTDSSILAFGAGLGAGLGLGASLLVKMTPTGRLATVLFSAAAGAVVSSLETTPKKQTTPQEQSSSH